MAAVLLDDTARSGPLATLIGAGWCLVDARDAINKTYNFRDFNEAWSWMSAIAIAGEKMDHHPEWFNVYNKVEVTWSTHECGGLSARDIKMATFCDNAAKRYNKPIDPSASPSKHGTPCEPKDS